MSDRRTPLLLSISWRQVLAAALLALLFGAASFWGRWILAAPLRATNLAFLNPSTVMAGPDGLIVVNDSGDRRIIGFGEDGSLRFVVKGQRRNSGFYNGRAIGFGDAGRFFVDDTVLDLETGNARNETILAFDLRCHVVGDVFLDKLTNVASECFLLRGVCKIHSLPSSGPA